MDSFVKLLESYSLFHPRAKGGTLEQYRIAVNLVRDWRPDIEPEELFTKTSMALFSRWLREVPEKRSGRLRAGATVNGKLFSLWTLWAFAHEEGLVTNPPMNRKRMPLAEYIKECPEAWSVEEMGKILRSVKAAPKCFWWGEKHWLSLLTTYWFTAERFVALMSCTWDDLQGDCLIVRGVNDKAKKYGVHRLAPWLLKQINELPRVPEDNRIWAFPHTMQTMRSHYRQILQKAGLPGSRDCLFQKIRRSAGTEMANRMGVERASQLLRHSSVQITKKNYLDWTKMESQATSEIMRNPLEAVTEEA